MATASKAIRTDDGAGLNIRGFNITEAAETRLIQSVAISDGDDGTPIDVVGEGALEKGLLVYGHDGTVPRAIQTDTGGIVTVSGTVTANAGTGTLAVSAASLPLPTGAATAALQLPDSHNVTVDNAAGAAAVNIQDGGNSLTIDAASLPLPTGAATAALQLPDSHNVTVDNAVGAAAVNVQDGGNALTVDWAGTAPPIGAGVEATALRVTVATDSTGVLSVDDNGGALTVDGTVTANAGTGTFVVSAASLPLPAGAATAALQLPDSHNVTVDNAAGAAAVNVQDGGNTLTVDGTVTVAQATASNLKAEVVGSVADDSPTPGNPITVAGFAVSPDGTDPGSVAEADVARLRTDLNRRLLVNTAHPNLWSYHENSSSALTDQAVAADPGDGFSLFITDIVFSTGAATACNIFFEEGATTILGPYYLEAIAGRGLALHFATPKKVTASTALTVTTSAAVSHGLDIHGFIAAV